MESQSENHSANYDVENPKQTAHNLSGPSFLEAAALLTVWSLLVMNEGSVRLMGLNPTDALLAGGRPSKLLLFLGALFEFSFGLLGLCLGATALIFRRHNTSITKLCMLIQTILGIYVFLLFVFIGPGFATADMADPLAEGLTVGESKFLATLGILISFNFCLALQGGQFVFMARLISEGTGLDFLRQKSGLKMRAVFWNANLGIAGLWTLIAGAIVNSKVGGGRLDAPVIASPNVVFLPGLTIFTGLGVFLLGMAGVILAVMEITPPLLYFVLATVVYVDGLLNFGIVQFALIGPSSEFSGTVAMLNGLLFMGVFIGPYFLHLASKEESAKEV